MVTVYTRDVPLIPPYMLKSVVLVYADRAHALAGEKTGATGYLVSVRLPTIERVMLHVVTAAHCFADRDIYVRVNKRDGGTEVIEVTASEWVRHMDGDDVAAAPIGLDFDRQDWLAMNIELFITEERISEHRIGPGDEVFMLGRFKGHEGDVQNVVTARFGNISSMPIEPIMREDGIRQESFLVEMRSLPGYSGSPVFCYVAPGSKRYGEPGEFAPSSSWPSGPWLLGLDWCHLRDKEPVRDKSGAELPEGEHVKVNTGMAGVVPAWKISEVLMGKELEKVRRLEEEAVKNEDSPVSLDFDTGGSELRSHG